MDFTDVITGIQQEFQKSVNKESGRLMLDWSSIHTLEDLGQPLKVIFKLQGDSVLLNLDTRIDIYSKYIENEFINLAHRLALTCIEGHEVPITYTKVELDPNGNLFDINFQKLNQITYVGETIDYGIQLLKGFYNVLESIDTLKIEKNDDILEFHMDLYMTVNFDMKKLM